MSQIYLPPSMTRFEPKHIVFSTWIDHLAFGYDIIEAIRPKVLVELGAHNGLSYFTFCQSILENSIDCVAYAVDSWEGDKHTGDYGGSVFQSVQKHNREYYRQFSYLLKTYFNEALLHFDDNSIDLLHIDGMHTYDAVREDFDSWYPKVSPGGIILFHDTCARIKDFGVWKFWEELTHDFPTFSFNHGFGLGVLRKPGGPEPDLPMLQLLFQSTPHEQEKLRQFYSIASHFLEQQRKIKRLEKQKSSQHQ